METETSEEKPFDVVVTAATSRIFCDGLAQTQLGYPTSTLYLHDQIIPGNEGEKDKRVARLLLTMPTVTMIEMATIILGSAKSFEANMLASSSQHQDRIRKALATLEDDEGKVATAG